MRFHTTEDQTMFQESVRGFLDKECTPDFVRGLWDTETGRSSELWAKLAEMGVLGMLVAEEHGGLGMNESDLVLVLKETGRAALPAPFVETAAVGARLLTSLAADDPSRTIAGATAATWLGRIATGESIVAVADPSAPWVADAHVADLVFLAGEGGLHALAGDQVSLEAQPCNDLSQKLFSASAELGAATLVANETRSAELLDEALNQGALAAAAQQLGIGQRLIDLGVAYACEREQFGKPIGSFQAIKHMLASAQVAVEYARPVVYRAAASLAAGLPVEDRDVHVSHAKSAASEAAAQAARAALQVHGAIGYTWEVDLHLWMKRAWFLEVAWGDGTWHRERVASALLDANRPAPSFGFEGRN